MSYPVYIRRDAEIDLAEALQWYESQQAGLSAEFLNEFDRVMARLAESPKIYPELYRGVRRAILQRFPYLIWYRFHAARVTVLACTHGKISPAAIADRVT